MSKTLLKYRSRKFLNKGFGMAAIQVSAHYNEYKLGFVGPPVFERSMDIGITISDCGNQINLDFNVFDEKQRKERLAKIDILIAEFEKVREILQAGPVGEKKGTFE